MDKPTLDQVVDVVRSGTRRDKAGYARPDQGRSASRSRCVLLAGCCEMGCTCPALIGARFSPRGRGAGMGDGSPSAAQKPTATRVLADWSLHARQIVDAMAAINAAYARRITCAVAMQPPVGARRGPLRPIIAVVVLISRRLLAETTSAAPPRPTPWRRSNARSPPASRTARRHPARSIGTRPKASSAPQRP